MAPLKTARSDTTQLLAGFTRLKPLWHRAEMPQAQSVVVATEPSLWHRAASSHCGTERDARRL
eukprot:15477098-Alexandrium_andersonii.AAC.1